MMNVKLYTDLEYAIMTLQDHGLFVNDHSDKGMQVVPIKTYKDIIEYSIGILKMLKGEIDIRDDVYNRQEEQIDALLKHISDTEVSRLEQ